MEKLIKLVAVSILLLLLAAAIPIAQQQGQGGQGTGTGTTNTQGCGLLSASLSSTITTQAPWYCPINQQVYNQWSSYLPAAMVVVFISFLIASLIFMAGVALNSTRIRNYGIGEFYEAIATAIIIVLFMYVCAVMFGLIPSLLVGTINPYATAFNLMSSTISTAEGMYSAIFKVYLGIAFSVSPTISVTIGNVGLTTSKSVLNFVGFLPQAIVNVWTIPATIYFLDPAKALAGFLGDGIMALYAEYYILVFFSVASLPAFIIPGVFFRAFAPTRALGGILIALGFGFYLIAPSLFAVAYYFTAPTIMRDMSTSTFQIQNLGNSGSASQAASPTSPLSIDLQSVRSSLSGFWLMIFFYPGLIMGITYAAILEIANFIGRAARISGKIRSFI